MNILSADEMQSYIDGLRDAKHSATDPNVKADIKAQIRAAKSAQKSLLKANGFYNPTSGTPRLNTGGSTLTNIVSSKTSIGFAVIAVIGIAVWYFRRKK